MIAAEVRRSVTWQASCSCSSVVESCHDAVFRAASCDSYSFLSRYGGSHAAQEPSQLHLQQIRQVSQAVLAPVADQSGRSNVVCLGSSLPAFTMRAQDEISK
eukprot:gnl/TRDRNA2_/TRDRNA2_74611_c0_seq1.p3 gnl/TRDRNA2_/TRDRNA2_74611_c0~~gnl/TRDRNA2_/TRDRNA2_74611_c0_seq1.p3  ORF type:complete len:102 (-),score=1.72 gnl/TRDRNA2_/TRDRNA2_74611_c0_seq1:49-354(-)